MSKTIEKPIVEDSGKTEILGVNLASATSKYSVEAFNNNVTTFEEVVTFFQRVCLYDGKTAEMYTLQIHKQGKAICYWGGKEACEFIISAFKAIGIEAKLLEA